MTDQEKEKEPIEDGAVVNHQKIKDNDKKMEDEQERTNFYEVAAIMSGMVIITSAIILSQVIKGWFLIPLIILGCFAMMVIVLFDKIYQEKTKEIK